MQNLRTVVVQRTNLCKILNLLIYSLQLIGLLNTCKNDSATELTHPSQYSRHLSDPAHSALQNRESYLAPAKQLPPHLHIEAFPQKLLPHCAEHPLDRLLSSLEENTSDNLHLLGGGMQ